MTGDGSAFGVRETGSSPRGGHPVSGREAGRGAASPRGSSLESAIARAAETQNAKTQNMDGESLDGDAPCPCGSGRTYAGCCGALHDGVRQAGTAEALMRSRYTAFALRNARYVLETWHPKTRPDQLRLAPGHTWTGLEILETQAGGADDRQGMVRYRAHSRSATGHAGSLTERSRFTRLGGRWVYVDGVIED